MSPSAQGGKPKMSPPARWHTEDVAAGARGYTKMSPPARVGTQKMSPPARGGPQKRRQRREECTEDDATDTRGRTQKLCHRRETVHRRCRHQRGCAERHVSPQEATGRHHKATRGHMRPQEATRRHNKAARSHRRPQETTLHDRNPSIWAPDQRHTLNRHLDLAIECVPGFRVIFIHIAAACDSMRQQQAPLPRGPARDACQLHRGAVCQIQSTPALRACRGALANPC